MSRDASQAVRDFPLALDDNVAVPAFPRSRRPKPVDFNPTERELQAFRRNLAQHPNINDKWLAAYLADQTWVHPDYTAAVEAEIRRRQDPREREK